MSWIVMQVNHHRWNEPIAKYQVVIMIERIGTLTDKLHEFSVKPAVAMNKPQIEPISLKKNSSVINVLLSLSAISLSPVVPSLDSNNWRGTARSLTGPMLYHNCLLYFIGVTIKKKKSKFPVNL